MSIVRFCWGVRSCVGCSFGGGDVSVHRSLLDGPESTLAAADDLAAVSDRQLAHLLADHHPRCNRVQYV